LLCSLRFRRRRSDTSLTGCNLIGRDGNLAKLVRRRDCAWRADWYFDVGHGAIPLIEIQSES
jgi:hypothetical protein